MADDPEKREAIASISQGNALDDPLVQHLQRQIGNAFVLHSNYKRYHWQTFGPLFRDFHLFFDELALSALGSLDELAERVRMIGPDPVAGPAEVMQVASVKPTGIGLSMREIVEEADAQLLVVIREMRDAVKLATESDDPGTGDLLTRLVQLHEKHEWWLRDMLKRGDGFFVTSARGA